MNNVATFKMNVATFLGSNEQCHNVGHERPDAGHECRDVGHKHRDVGHERRDVVGFFCDGKLVKIPSFGLLISSKLFFFTITIIDHLITILHEEQH